MLHQGELLTKHYSTYISSVTAEQSLTSPKSTIHAKKTGSFNSSHVPILLKPMTRSKGYGGLLQKWLGQCYMSQTYLKNGGNMQLLMPCMSTTESSPILVLHPLGESIMETSQH